MSLARRIARVPALRRAGVVSLRLGARAVAVYPPPRVVANSIPKAGTHLLASALSRFPRMMSSGIHHALNEFSVSVGIGPERIPDLDWAALERALRRVRNGQFLTAHFPAAPGLADLLGELGYAHVLMVRDPRDIVVSHTFYVTGLARHFLHRRYTQALRDPDARLMASIKGFAADEWGPGQESIGARLDKYLPWLDDVACHVSRFEDLVGERGGGSATRQREALVALASHVGREVDEVRVTRVVRAAAAGRTATFRKGAIGDWRNHFGDQHRDAFKQVAGRQLIRLGYEEDDDW